MSKLLNKQSQMTSNREIEREEDFKLNELIPLETKVVIRLKAEQGVMTIINSKKDGRRISLSNSVINKLGNPDKLQIALSKKGIVLGKNLPNTKEFFRIKKVGAKSMIYSAGLVREISEKFNLDFSNRVSITFKEVDYKNIDEYNLALLKVA